MALILNLGLGLNAGKKLFSPTDLSGLQLWMDGADTSTMTITGSDQITSWTDKSDNAIEFTAAGSVAPIMTANAFGTKSAPDFGTRTKRLRGVSAALKALDEITVIVVTKATTSSSSQAGTSVQFTPEFLSVGNWASGAVDYGGQYIGSSIVTNAMKHVNVTQQAALGSNTTQMGWIAGAHSDAWVGMYEAGASGSAMLRGTFQMGNAVATSGVTNATDFSPATLGITSNDIMLGSVINSSTQVGRGLGYIAEVLVYDRYLTASEKLQVKNYCQAKWGIQSQVPAIHNICWGQSNKVTTDVLKSAAPSEFTSPTVGAYYYINGQYVHYCDTNVNQQSATEYGTEQRFSRALYAETGMPVIVSKLAVAATDIASWTGPSGSNYGTLSTRVTSAIDNIQGFGFSFADTVMTFQQGEADGLIEAKALAYETNLGDAVDYWMDNYGLGAIPIIADQIWVDATTVTYRENIRNATLAVAAARPNMRIIDTDAGTTSDGIHWDADTVDDIALAEVQAYLTKTNQSI